MSGVQKLANSDITSLVNLHTNLRNDNANLKFQQKEIIEILGGIDEILSHYILMTKNNSSIILNHSLNSKSLNSSQIQQITKILETTAPTLSRRKSIREQNIREIIDPNEFDELLEIENDAKLTYTLDAKDTILHEIFGEERGQQMIRIIYNTKLISLGIILFAVFWVLWEFLGFNDKGSAAFFVFLILYQWICIIWSILFVMSMNRKCFTLLSKEMGFWFQLCYSVLMQVLDVCILYNEEFKGNVLGSVVGYVWRIIFIIGILIVSSVDALPNRNRYVQVFLCFCACIGMAVLTIYWSFTSWEWPYIFSIEDMAATRNALSITLTCFFFKQMVFSYFKWDRCIGINYSPNIEWITFVENNNKNNVGVENHTPQSIDECQLETHINQNQNIFCL